jgi:hypothetical protein
VANANIAQLTTANTFGDQMIGFNNLANSINELRNGNYYKDVGNFTIANGALTIAGLGTILSVSGNATISGLLTVSAILNFGDVTIQGNNVLLTTNTVLMQCANTIQTKNLIANVGIQTVNANSSGLVSLSGLTISINSSPILPGLTERATLNVNSAFLVSNTGNTQFRNANGNTINAITGNIQTLFVQTLDAFNLILDPTVTYTIQNGNAVFNNLTVRGNQVIVGNVINSTDTFVLRANSVSDGDGHFEVYRGPTVNSNAHLKFNHTNNVWSVTANDSQTFFTILTTANLVDNFSNTSTTMAASANAVNAAVGAAISNATAIVANNGVFVAQRKGLNIIVQSNTNLTLNVTANASNTNLTDVVINSNITDSFLSNSIFSVATANAVNAVYAAASAGIANATAIFANNGSFVASRRGLDIIAGNNITINVSSNVANSNLVDAMVSLSTNIILVGSVTAQNNTIQQPVLKSERYQYSNVGSVGTIAKTIDLASLGNFCDITLTGNPTLTVTNTGPSGTVTMGTIYLRQDSAGSRTVTWANNIKWSDNIQPVLSTGVNVADIIQLTTYNAGVIWWGSQVMANIPGANVY